MRAIANHGLCDLYRRLFRTSDGERDEGDHDQHRFAAAPGHQAVTIGPPMTTLNA
jgi:hypothetical protein